MNLAATTLKRTIYTDPKIINLYETDSQISSIGLNSIINAIIKNPRFEQYLKEYMEISIYSNYLKLLSGSIHKIDNPFDSIYIADLSPDSIPFEAKDRIISIARKIEDRSSEIIFNDGLDD
jgi:hypothetical protein